MSTTSVLICLGVSNVLIVAMLTLYLRTQSPVVSRRTRVVGTFASLAFIAHAFIFFKGAILYMELATIAIIFLLMMLRPSKKQGANVISG